MFAQLRAHPVNPYKYSDTDPRISEKQWTGFILNMTSQTWLTKDDSDRSVWWHILVVIIPKIQHTDFSFCGLPVVTIRMAGEAVMMGKMKISLLLHTRRYTTE